MTTSFQNVLPSKFLTPQPVTTSKSILRKQLIEILPVEQTSYSPDAYDLIRFNFSSNTDFVDYPNSYMKFNYQQKNTLRNFDTALDVGGVHALFRSLEVRFLQSGILGQRIDLYHTWNALQSKIYDDPDDIQQRGNAYGDSMSVWPVEAPFSRLHSVNMATMESSSLGDVVISFESKDADTTTYGQTYTNVIIADRHVRQWGLQVGDIVDVHDFEVASGPNVDRYRNVKGEVLAISYNGVNSVVAVACRISEYATNDIAATIEPVSKFQILKKGNVNRSARQILCNGNVHTVVMKPRMSILQQVMPLFLLRGGLELQLELERGTVSLHQFKYLSHLYDDTKLNVQDAQVSYEITQPRYMAMMLTPHNDIVNEYRNAFNNQGLLYSIPSVRMRRFTGVADENDQSVQVNIGVRSARIAYVVVKDSGYAESSSLIAQLNPSVSGFLRDNISTYQMKIGAHEFPHREVHCDEFSREAWEQLKNTTMGGLKRISPSEWRSAEPTVFTSSSSEGADIPVADAQSFIIGVDLSRDQGVDSELTGSDLSIVPLDLDIKRTASHASNGWTGSPVFYFFVQHDAILKIHQNEIAVLQ